MGRYKMVATWGPDPNATKGSPGYFEIGAYAFKSADGIRFEPMRPGTIAYTGSDTGQVAFFDASLGKYVAYRRMFTSIVHRSCSWCVGSPPVCGE